jgi:hypothetical protein
MTDYSEQGAIPVEDAATDDPPTVDEVLERQREEYPEQAATAEGSAGEMQHPGDAAGRPDAMRRPGAMREGAEDGEDEVEALLDAGGEPVGDPDEVQGPNPA